MWVTDQQTPGTVIQLSSPRSYQIQTSSGTLRRNRRHLNRLTNIASDVTLEPDMTTRSPPPEADSQVNLDVPSTDVRCTRSGRISVPPSRLIEDRNWQ